MRPPEPDLRVHAAGFVFLEAPSWRDGLLYASDVLGKRVVAIDAAGAAETLCRIEAHPSGLGFTAAGELLVVAGEERRILRRSANGECSEHADLAAFCTGPANDMIVDRHGRAYVGNYGGGDSIRTAADLAPANLIRVDPDGTASVAATDMFFANGMALDAAQELLLVAESVAYRITAFDVDEAGALSNRRVWASFGEAPDAPDFAAAMASGNLVPDGIALDVENGLWVADASGGHGVRRILEGGEVTDVIDPSTGHGVVGVAPALGGVDGHTFYLCAAPPPFDQLTADDPRSCLLTRRVEVPSA